MRIERVLEVVSGPEAMIGLVGYVTNETDTHYQLTTYTDGVWWVRKEHTGTPWYGLLAGLEKLPCDTPITVDVEDIV